MDHALARETFFLLVQSMQPPPATLSLVGSTCQTLLDESIAQVVARTRFGTAAPGGADHPRSVRAAAKWILRHGFLSSTLANVVYERISFFGVHNRHRHRGGRGVQKSRLADDDSAAAAATAAAAAQPPLLSTAARRIVAHNAARIMPPIPLGPLLPQFVAEANAALERCQKCIASWRHDVQRGQHASAKEAEQDMAHALAAVEQKLKVVGDVFGDSFAFSEFPIAAIESPATAAAAAGPDTLVCSLDEVLAPTASAYRVVLALFSSSAHMGEAFRTALHKLLYATHAQLAAVAGKLDDAAFKLRLWSSGVIELALRCDNTNVEVAIGHSSGATSVDTLSHAINTIVPRETLRGVFQQLVALIRHLTERHSTVRMAAVLEAAHRCVSRIVFVATIKPTEAAVAGIPEDLIQQRAAEDRLMVDGGEVCRVADLLDAMPALTIAFGTPVWASAEDAFLSYCRSPLGMKRVRDAVQADPSLQSESVRNALEFGAHAAVADAVADSDAGVGLAVVVIPSAPPN